MKTVMSLMLTLVLTISMFTGCGRRKPHEPEMTTIPTTTPVMPETEMTMPTTLPTETTTPPTVTATEATQLPSETDVSEPAQEQTSRARTVH